MDDIRRKKIVELCANQCAMYRDSCDAFYVKLRGDGTNCHMVEESDTKRTIGYGQDRLDVYYVKQVSKVRSDGKIEIRSQRFL